MSQMLSAPLPWLSILVALPALGAVLLLAIPSLRQAGRAFALILSLCELVVAIVAAVAFDWSHSSTYQLSEAYSWIPQIGLSWALAVNALGLVMILLAVALVPLVVVAGWNEDENPSRTGAYLGWVLFLESFMVLIFAASDVLLFYLAFEGMLVPLFVMIGRYGVGETLFKMDDQLEPQPWLAEKIEQPSQLEWKITLRNDVTFQNGEKMTGAKVEASLKRLIEKSKRAADDLGIESIHSDGQTVTIKTKIEQPIMKNLLAEPYSVIVDVDGKAASDKSPVGTGPFLIKTYTPETGATLEAYENYWGGKAKVAQVQIKYFSDPRRTVSIKFLKKKVAVT